VAFPRIHTARVVYTTEKKEELEKNPNRNVIIKIIATKKRETLFTSWQTNRKAKEQSERFESGEEAAGEIR
jgi:hypothetical protein